MYACFHLPQSEAADDATRELLLDAAASLGPVFECSDERSCIVDLAGCRVSHDRIAAAPPLCVALGPTPDLARLAAVTGIAGPGVIASPQALDCAPLAALGALNMPEWDRAMPVLSLWGLRTLGDFRRLPKQGTAERLGPALLRLHDTLNGLTRRPLHPHRYEEPVFETIHLEPAVADLASLLFLVGRILARLCGRLRESGLAATALSYRIVTECGHHAERIIRLPEPTASPDTLRKAFGHAVETLELPSAVATLGMGLEPVHPPGAQHGLFGRKLRQPTRWPDTLAALESLLGTERIGIPLPGDSHRPDDVSLGPAPGRHETTRADAAPEFHAPPASSVCPAPLRRYRPAIPVSVACAGKGWRDSPLALLTGPCRETITRAQGPYPLSGCWWHGPTHWRRVEWDVQTAGGHLLRLARLTEDLWQLEGSY
jgi:protein ImuB